MKLKLPKNLPKNFSQNYKKIIVLVLAIFCAYLLFFLYQNFFLVLIFPSEPDISSFQTKQLETNDKLYQQIQEQTADRQEETVQIDQLIDPF